MVSIDPMNDHRNARPSLEAGHVKDLVAILKCAANPFGGWAPCSADARLRQRLSTVSELLETHSPPFDLPITGRRACEPAEIL